jgi:hypothetical protein
MYIRYYFYLNMISEFLFMQHFIDIHSLDILFHLELFETLCFVSDGPLVLNQDHVAVWLIEANKQSKIKYLDS